VVEVVPVSKVEAEACIVPVVQSKSTLVFGNAEHIRLSRNRYVVKQAPTGIVTTPQEVQHVEPVSKPIVVPAAMEVAPSTEQAEASAKARSIQPQSTLVFGNTEHIRLSHQRRKKEKVSPKPIAHKRVLAQSSGCECCGGREEEMLITPKAVPGQRQTLWELIESSSQSV
jgi:hypothetical protein